MEMTDRFVNLVEEGVDLAIRIADLPDSSFVARKLGFVCNILLRFRIKNYGNLFISSSFLMKHGAVYATYRALSPDFSRVWLVV